MKTVGIIGGGAAGLCALKHILSEATFTPLFWEQSQELGGTWIYTPETGKDIYGYPIHSSMYRSLITNLPKEIMAFPDFPFKEDENSFLHHTKVLQYLNEYADHFRLKTWIKFNHRVEWIEPVEKDDQFTKWNVTVKNLVEGISSTFEVDNIIVCNGHYFEPRLPHIANIELFEGLKIHSHCYRIPDPFVGLKTVVLGSKGSGLDISLEVTKKAEMVYLSHNLALPIPSTLPSNLRQVKGVLKAKTNGFVLCDNTYIEADAIIYCTGYEYSFPFLSPGCGICVEDNQVQTLYKHIVNAAFPSMGFIGIPFMICPFPLFDIQVQYIIKVFERVVCIPSLIDVHETARCSSVAKRHYHQLGSDRWTYLEDLQTFLNSKVIFNIHQKIYDIVSFRRLLFLPNYKMFSYSCERKEGKVTIVEEFEGRVRTTTYDLINAAFKQVFLHAPAIIRKTFRSFYQKCLEFF